MRVAVTGTIGSGKSMVIAIIKELGYKTLSCDDIAHKLQEKGQKGYLAISKAFPEVIDNETINRLKLAEIVFNDEEQLAKLNAMMLPLIKEELIKAMDEEPLVFVEVPLLFETDFDTLFESSILVYADEDIVIKRLKERGLSIDAIKKRMASQMSSEKKKALADYLIENNQNLNALKNKINEIIKEVERC